MTEEQKKKRKDKLCKKAGWNNGPGHCEGVAFHNVYDAGFTDAKEEILKLKTALGVAGEFIKRNDELTRKLEVAKSSLASAETAIDHALKLGYVGEGSTKGLFKQALKDARTALKEIEK